MNTSARNLLEQGSAKLKEGLPDDAIDAFTACLAIEPQDLQALHGRATARFQIKAWPEAEADYRAAHDLAPDDPDIWSGLALSMGMQEQKVVTAMGMLEDLIRRHPQYIPAHLQLGMLHFQLGAINKGREHLKKALTLRPPVDLRRHIEETLKTQDILDKRRMYRPDFVKLRREKGIADAPGLWSKISGFFGRKAQEAPR